MKSLFIGAIAGLVFLGIHQVRADVTWDWNITNGMVGSGQFVTADLSAGSYLVTSVTGTIDGFAVTGLIPVGNFNSNDNKLLTSFPQVDQAGISFSSASFQYNIYSVPGSPATYNMDTTDPNTRTITDVSFTATPVPEPSTYMLLGVGVLLLGITASYQRSVRRA